MATTRLRLSLIKTLRHCSSIYESRPPVMMEQVLSALDLQPNQTVLDMTFGAGGHCRKLLAAVKPLQVFALDRDPSAFAVAKSLQSDLEKESSKSPVVAVHGRFSDVVELLEEKGLGEGSLDACLIDCGLDDFQLNDPNRGFTPFLDAPLDMRMNPKDEFRAVDVLNSLRKEDLAQMFSVYGEEQFAWRVAKCIIELRQSVGAIETTAQLQEVVAASVGSSDSASSVRRVFQALRVFVNDELNELDAGIRVAERLLRAGGRLAVISFNAMEDRVVKRHFHNIPMEAEFNMSLVQRARMEAKSARMEALWRPISKKAWRASPDNILLNQRAKHARLRCATRK